MKPADLSAEVLEGRPIICEKYLARGDAYMMADALVVRSLDDDIYEAGPGVPVVLDYRHLRLFDEPTPSSWMAL